MAPIFGFIWSQFYDPGISVALIPIGGGLPGAVITYPTAFKRKSP